MGRSAFALLPLSCGVTVVAAPYLIPGGVRNGAWPEATSSRAQLLPVRVDLPVSTGDGLEGGRYALTEPRYKAGQRIPHSPYFFELFTMRPITDDCLA